MKKNTKKISAQKMKYGSVATIFLVLFLAVVILVNVLFSFLAERVVLNIDLTDNGFYDLSDSTLKTLESLNEDITITILDRDDFTYTRNRYAGGVDEDYLNAFPELFNRYEIYSGGKVTVRFLDPYTNPTAIADYTTEFETPSVTDVIVESSKRSVHLSSVDFFELETNYSTTLTSSTYQTVAGLQVEQKLTSAILYSVTDELPTAVFIEGHGESTMDSLSGLLIAGNYELKTVNLLTDDIPEETTLVVIAGPSSDFADSEINELDAYFDRGGNGIFLSKGSSPNLPNLEVYLQEWGVRFDRTLVMDDSRNLMYQLNVLPYVEEVEGLTESLVASDSLVVAANSRALDLLWDTDGNWRTTQPILYTGSSAYGKDLDSENISLERQDGDLPGPFDLAAITTHEDPNEDGVTSKIFFASEDLANDTYLASSTYLNQQLFVEVINDFNPMGESVIIDTKGLATDEMSIQAWQGTIIFWILVVVLPVLFLAAGTLIWIRRRNM